MASLLRGCTVLQCAHSSEGFWGRCATSSGIWFSLFEANVPTSRLWSRARRILRSARDCLCGNVTGREQTQQEAKRGESIVCRGFPKDCIWQVPVVPISKPPDKWMRHQGGKSSLVLSMHAACTVHTGSGGLQPPAGDRIALPQIVAIRIQAQHFEVGLSTRVVTVVTGKATAADMHYFEDVGRGLRRSVRQHGGCQGQDPDFKNVSLCSRWLSAEGCDAAHGA